MDIYRVEYGRPAREQIRQIVRYIADVQQAPVNAARYVDRLLDEIARLELLPHCYPVDRRATRRLGVQTRRLVFERTYLIFYSVNVNSRTVTVLDVKHGARKH